MRVAIYARVSTVRQAENDLSIPDQLRQLRDWAKANGHIVVEEFVEPGASATDDKRPEFQRMIESALIKPAQIDLIVIHSFSRFFRDAVQFGLYERKLAKNKVRVISITQQTSDDTAGEMMRRIINTFDEYSSKENSKHTSRAMRENARQGFFNGSRPPYGYDSITTDIQGSRGRKKKKLAINQDESVIVRKIYDLYAYGNDGKDFGCKEIAMHLNTAGYQMRGQPFTMQKVHRILSDTLYNGDYFFNVIDSKTGETRPAEEWVKTSIPAIINSQLFEHVKNKREARTPATAPIQRVLSKTLLTGLIKCGECGGFMTKTTGKGGRYEYYKCTSRCSKGNQACSSKSLPLDKVNNLVLQSLTEKIFTASKLQQLLSAYRQKMLEDNATISEKVTTINRQIQHIEERQKRLLDAIELGAIELDETTLERSQDLKRAKEALQIEKHTLLKPEENTLPEFRTSQLDKLSKLISSKLMSSNPDTAKGYLKLLVNEVTVKQNVIEMKGPVIGLVQAVKAKDEKNGHLNQVPISLMVWRARRESNPRPLASETNTLSI